MRSPGHIPCLLTAIAWLSCPTTADARTPEQSNCVVTDAAVSYQGNRITGVNDVSDDTYMGSVPQFPGGSYAMTYDAAGRLTSDGTRSIRKISYHDWGDLPRHISFTGGGSVVSNYRADGALVERREYEPLFIAATLGLTAFDKEPITPGIGGGEIAGNMVGRRRYFGPWEHVDGSGWLLHTPEGVYDLARHEHYWHLRDRLGSVRAVVDKAGTVVQATRYFASGVPVRVDVAGGRRVSDRGHIGNRWVAHAGLDWYDNSARMHDPLLARFTTMDPFHDKYTQYSPYSHCAGNPVNNVDPTGCVIEGVNKKDASMAVEDFRAMFPGDEFANFRNLIVQSGNKQNDKSFAPISADALTVAFSGITLNEDQQALVEMVVNTINSDDIHKVEYLTPGKDMSRSSLNKFLPKLNSLGITSEMVENMPGGASKFVMALCGEASTILTKSGSLSVIVQTESDFVTNRPATLGHEIIGHGRSLRLGYDDPQSQHIFPVQVENLILRNMRSTLFRDGKDHAPMNQLIPNYMSLPNYR